MYKFRFILLLLILLIYPSCIHDSEDCDDISSDNVKLDIEYTDSSGKDLLKEYVYSAKLFIYNQSGDLVGIQDVNDLESNSKSIGLLVPTEGDFNVVCWANVGENSSLMYIDKQNEAYIEHLSSTLASDPLYYGECSFNFTNGVKQSLKLNLRPIHIKLRLTVKGLESTNKLSVNLTNSLSSYNFDGVPNQNARITLTQTLNYVEQKKGFVANFNVMKPKTINNDMVIKLESSFLSKPLQFNLIDYIREQYPNINISDLYKEIMLDMLIQFDGLDVTISIENWDDINTGGIVG